MLDFMRRNANSWVMIFLFAIIIFVFAINFGPWAGRLSENVPYAATVNSIPISIAEFHASYMGQMARIKQFNPSYSDEQAQKDGLKQMVLDQLIARELLTQLGLAQKMKIGATTLAGEIKERVFGPDAPFDKVEYAQRIQNYFQTTPAQFEELVAKEMIASNMADLLGTGVFVSENETKKSFLDRNTKMTVEFVKVNPEHFKLKGASLAQIAEFAAKNQEKISTYYNENVEKFVKEPEVKASHILVKVAHDASPADKAKQKARIEALVERVKKGEDFAKVAQSESEDLGSKMDGGDLGFFSEGKMVPEFAKAAFALKPGEVSGVVETPFGFHIIKVIDRTEEQKTTLAQATNEIAETLIKLEEQKKEAKALAELALAQLKAGLPLEKIQVPGLVNKKLKKDAKVEFEPVADETLAFTKASGFIPGIGRAAGFGDQAFRLSDAQKTAGEVFESNGQFFAIRLKSREEADLSKFETEKESIRNSVLYARKRAFIQQYIVHMKSNAKIKYNKELVGTGEIKV